MITFDTGVTVQELRARLKGMRRSRRIFLSVEVWPEAPAKRPKSPAKKSRRAKRS